MDDETRRAVERAARVAQRAENLVAMSGGVSDEDMEKLNQAAQQERAARWREQMDGWVKAGILRVNLAPYAHPWPEAVEQNREAWKVARRWKPEHGNVIAFGPHGIGKSALCRYILSVFAWNCLDRAYLLSGPIADVSAVSLATKLSSYEHEVIFERLTRVGVLNIDDMDKATWTPRSLSLLWELIDLRSENRRPILMTANVAPAELHAQLCAARPDNTAHASAVLARLRPHIELSMDGKNLRQLREFGSWEKRDGK